MNDVLGAGMVAASGAHLVMGCGDRGRRTILRLGAETVMALAMLDVCLLTTARVPAGVWSVLLLLLAGLLLGSRPVPGRDGSDSWHAAALALAAGLLAVPHAGEPHAATHGMHAGLPATDSAGVLVVLLLTGVTAYAVVAVGRGLDHVLARARGRSLPGARATRPGRPLLSAVGLTCMAALALG